MQGGFPTREEEVEQVAPLLLERGRDRHHARRESASLRAVRPEAPLPPEHAWADRLLARPARMRVLMVPTPVTLRAGR